MANIYNKCLLTGIYPDQWKHSLMVPIPKNNNPLHLNSLRPISLVPLPGKLFEKILHSRLSSYFESNDLLCIEQGGFRKEMDTSYAIFDLVNYISTGFNSNNLQCLAAFADLAKAFDSIDRKLLLKKLEIYGVKGNILKLLTSYLTNRKQQVNLNGILSELKPINSESPREVY